MHGQPLSAEQRLIMRRRSQRYGSLSIWVKYINDGLYYQESYKPSVGSCQTNYTGRAIRIGGGYVWDDLYKFAHEHESIVVGGGDSVRDSLDIFKQILRRKLYGGLTLSRL